MKYIPIAGTDAFYDSWYWDINSYFQQFLLKKGFNTTLENGRYFRWSTSLDGINKYDWDWQAAGDALAYFLADIPIQDRNLIAHSHGGQVAIFCASYGLTIRSLTTVGTPIRSDVPVDSALNNIKFWQHIYDSKWDLMGWLGKIGDPHARKERYYSQPQIHNISIGGISHSKILRDSQFIPYWSEKGWLNNIINGGINVLNSNQTSNLVK